MEEKMCSSKELSLKEVRINDQFWTPYIKLVKEIVIPYQWDVLNDRVSDADPSHAIRNFRIAAGLEDGEFYGFVFQDTDLAKWLEAVAYSLSITPNDGLERLADDAIELVGKAQQPDGYLNTYFTINKNEKRWSNLEECHELYTAGHFIEAAVAYYQATGKRKLLDIMCRFADYIDTVFGSEDGKLHGYPGHQEIELALVRLYRETGNEKYLMLSKYFLDERAKEPYYFKIEWQKRNRISHWDRKESKDPQERSHYLQSHLPVRKQKEAVGHAVRLVYMLTGMAEVAKECKDREMLIACQNLWENIVTKQLYITGGIGSTSLGEAFTFDYDLPNDTVYAETCASIGLIVFAHKMLQIENKRCYADVIERALYNIIIASMSQDGKHYFYVNPLEVWPEASNRNPVKNHVKPVRQKWFGCACCPPNLARLLTSLGRYIYTYDTSTVFVHQYISSEASFEVQGGLKVKQTSNYPWDGDVRIELTLDKDTEFGLALRIPSWCKNASITVNGESMEVESMMKEGYAYLSRVFSNGTVVTLHLDMPVTLMQANPNVRVDAGKVAIQRGPVVYCVEEVDNGRNLSAITLDANIKMQVRYEDALLFGAMTIEASGYREKEWSVTIDEEALYTAYRNEKEAVRIKAVPYGIWGNRNPGEMAVWIRV